MYCISCGTKNPEYAAFCYKCGAKLVNNGPEQAAQPSDATPETAPTASQASVNNGNVIKAEDLADKSRRESAGSNTPNQPPSTNNTKPTSVENNQTTANNRPASANPYAAPQPPNPNQSPMSNPYYTGSLPSNPNQPPNANPFAGSPNNRPTPPANSNQPTPSNYPYPTGPLNQPPANRPTGAFPPVNYPPNLNNQFGRPPTGAYPSVPPTQQPPVNNPTGGFSPAPPSLANTGGFVPAAQPQNPNPTGGFLVVPPSQQPPMNNPTGQFRPANNPTGSIPQVPVANPTGGFPPVNKPSEPNVVAPDKPNTTQTGQFPPATNVTTNNPAAPNTPVKSTANPYAQVPPTPPVNPTPSWPGANPNPAPGSFNQPPINPYGAYNFAPPVPPRNAIAPNGLPYVVVDNPNRYFKYKNKDGKQVYAAYAEPRLRLIAAIVDTIVVLFPFFIVLVVYMASLPPDVINKLNTASQNGDASVLNQYFPHWLTLVVAVAYLAYCTLLTAANGQTLGKVVTGLKVITQDGSKPDLRTSLLRNLFGFGLVLGNYIAYYEGFAAFLGQVLSAGIAMGFLFIIFDPKRQGWHDKLANTLVVRSKELVEGRDFPAKGQQS